jgi:thiamine-monophosphate kinase
MYAGHRLKPSRASQHFFPQPRLETGQWLRRQRVASAMIDLSDGLSVDLAHICKESRVSATISAAALPIATGADLHSALHGGEDYELLFTVSVKAKVPDKIAGVRVTEIGHIDGGKPGKRKRGTTPLITLVNPNGRPSPLEPLGWEHFRS